MSPHEGVTNVVVGIVPADDVAGAVRSLRVGCVRRSPLRVLLVSVQYTSPLGATVVHSGRSIGVAPTMSAAMRA